MAAQDDITPEPSDENIVDLIRDATSAAKPLPDAKAKEEDRKLFGDAKRDDRYKGCIHWVKVIGVVTLGICVVAVIAVRIVHMILPPQQQWITSEQMKSLDQFLFSGTVGGVLTSVANKLLGKPDK